MCFERCEFMDLLKNYCSDDSSSGESEKIPKAEALTSNEVRSVYLVTYSQADIVKFASRGDFNRSKREKSTSQNS